jgi:hypothetical protein
MACEIPSDLQVKTYSSIGEQEKTEFIFVKMRLLNAVAWLKDAELNRNLFSGGKSVGDFLLSFERNSPESRGPQLSQNWNCISTFGLARILCFAIWSNASRQPSS